MRLFAHWNDERWEIEAERDGEHVVVIHDGKRHRMRFDELRTHYRSMQLDSRRVAFGWVRDGDRYQVVLEAVPYDIVVKDALSERIGAARKASGGETGTLEVRAPIPGLIAKVMVRAGDKVKEGQALMTLNAMKMENEIAAPRAGTVEDVLVEAGQTVDRDAPLALLR
jgi:biotin carboxyl carrier protein